MTYNIAYVVNNVWIRVKDATPTACPSDMVTSLLYQGHLQHAYIPEPSNSSVLLGNNKHV